MKYLKYFYYLATNWNTRIALHMIRHEIKGEKKYGINTTGADELENLMDSGIDTTHATIYMPASYDLLETMMKEVQKHGCKKVVDLGCGKGRILCVAAHFGILNLSGVDFSSEFCQQAKQNLAITASKIPGLKYEIYNNDAFYFQIPDDTDCIFLFNPFDEIIMSGVIENIRISLEKFPRKLLVVYLNPMHMELFQDAGYKEIFKTKKLNYLEGSILSNLN